MKNQTTRLATLREALAKASAGPWYHYYPDQLCEESAVGDEGRGIVAMTGDSFWNPEAIALLHNSGLALVEVAEAARELVTPCEHERGFCIAHGTARLPCPVGELAAALVRLEGDSA